MMKKVKKFWPFILIGLVVLVFFYPVFKGYIPFPGDLLVNVNPYNSQGYLGYAAGGYPNKAQGMDVVSEIYPWRYFSMNQLKQGNIPFWNPHNFSGNPQMADFQTAIFYPFNFLYFLTNFNLSWTLLIMLQPMLAGIFMYLFLKKGVGLKDFPSFIGGISFGFSSYMSVWMEYGNIGSTFLWLPLVLLFIKKFSEKTNVKNFLGISIPLSISILAGYIQGVFYIYVISFFYYVYLIFQNKNSLKNFQKNFLFVLSLVLPFLITSFQIFPTLQLFSQSTRGAYALSQIERNLAPLSSWITIVFPDFFGNPATRNYWADGTYIEKVVYPGTVILFFTIYTILNFRKIKFSEKNFFAITALVSLLIATNLPFVKYFYLIPIPVISTTVATRELSIFIFSMIVLGSIGLEYFINKKAIKHRIISLYIGFFASVWTFVFLISKTSADLVPKIKITERNLILPTLLTVALIFAFYIKNKNVKITGLFISAIVILDLFYFFNKITPFSPMNFAYPATPIISYITKTAGINRFWGYGTAYIPPNFQTVDGTYSPEGNDPLHIARYGELLASSVNGKLPDVLPRPDANVAPGYGPNDLKDNFYRKRVLDLLGVKYILNKEELSDLWQKEDLTTFPQNQYKMVDKIYPWQIYENKNSVPRFFVTGDFVLAKNKSQVLSFIYNPNIDLKKTVILESLPALRINQNASGTATLLSYKPNNVLFQTDSMQNTLLFLSDNYYPEWGVRIDGISSKVLIADYTFRAVEVPRGQHKVEFFYNPKSFNYGLGVAAGGFIILFFTLFYIKNNEKKF